MELNRFADSLKFLTFILLFAPCLVFANKLEDVKILNVSSGANSLKLKLRANNGPEDSYFYLDITKSDPDSFDKLVHVTQKVMRGEEYKLDLDIPSFSLIPSGSYYRSNEINFYGTPIVREPSSAKSRQPKKNKK